MTNLTCPPCSPPRAPLAAQPVRPDVREPRSEQVLQTTWLRPRYSLSALGQRLAVQVEAAAAPC